VKGAPNKIQAKLLAEAHESAAAALRRFSQGKCTIEEAAVEYAKAVAFVQRELADTKEWRDTVHHLKGKA
jgi:hypothetical protein